MRALERQSAKLKAEFHLSESRELQLRYFEYCQGNNVPRIAEMLDRLSQVLIRFQDMSLLNDEEKGLCRVLASQLGDQRDRLRALASDDDRSNILSTFQRLMSKTSQHLDATVSKAMQNTEQCR